MLSYNSLPISPFKYFIKNDQILVFKTDIPKIPAIGIAQEIKNSKEIAILPIDKLELIVKDCLLNKKIEVIEYKEYETGKKHNVEIVMVNDVKYFENKSGSPCNLNDFSELCISSEIPPTICSIEEIQSPRTSANIRFRVLSDCKILETSYFDDDLLSISYSLLSLHNSIEILYSNDKFMRIFNSWGINNNKVKNDQKGHSLIEIYLKRSFDLVLFTHKDSCLVNISEILETSSPGDKSGNLLYGFTLFTPQGKRLLNQWLRSPLVSAEEIGKRLDISEIFSMKYNVGFREENDEMFGSKSSLINTSFGFNGSAIFDIKKMANRIANKSISINEIIKIYSGVMKMSQTYTQIKNIYNSSNTKFNVLKDEFIEPLESILTLCTPMMKLIKSKINISDENRDSRDGYLNENVSEELDRLKKQKGNYEKLSLEELENVRRIFPRVKLSNSEGGVYRVSKGEYSALNGNGGNRFEIIKMLKSGVTFTTKLTAKYSEEISKINLSIQDEIDLILFDIKAEVFKNLNNLEILNYFIGLVDVYCGLGVKCITPGYSRPEFAKAGKISGASTEYRLSGLFHPFIVNDPIKNDIDFLNKNTCIVTGPNMGGKSTLIKTIALVSLFAQIGSYVPCENYACLPIFNSILLRAGARDISYRGISTFMVEMNEVNKICRGNSAYSDMGCADDVAKNKLCLNLIDELGRGTSVIDGLSLCVAVKEFLCKTNSYNIITTHFSELSTYGFNKDNLNNENILNKKMFVNEDDVITYKLVDGICDDSFGVNVAKKVKFPKEVIESIESYIQEK